MKTQNLFKVIDYSSVKIQTDCNLHLFTARKLVRVWEEENTGELSESRVFD